MGLVEKLEGSEGPVVGYKFVGRLDGPAYEEWVAHVEGLAEEYGRLYMLADATDCKGATLRAYLDDFKWFLKLRKRFGRVALVTDDRMWRVETELAGDVLSGQVRAFHKDDIADAWQWVREGVEA